MSPHLIWRKRLDAFLEAYIVPLRNSLDAAAGTPLNIPDPTRELLFTTVVAFQDFAETHFNFFNNGFFHPSGMDGHIQTTAFSPLHVMSQVLARISQDVHLMQQMTLQRVVKVIPDPMRTFLDQTDNLAARTLKLAVDRQWVHADSYVLTFYERMLSARVVPFVRLAWIGIPLTAFKARRDLLAVPHEVGHYVYANGKIPLNGTPIYVWQWLQQVQAEPEFKDYPWLAEWAEEIFADIYGCLVAGDAIALTSQLMAEQSSRGPQGAIAADADLLPSHLFHNNGHHPIPYFRPLVYIRTLERLGSAGSAELKKRWERKQLSYSGEDSSYAALYIDYIRAAIGNDCLLKLLMTASRGVAAPNTTASATLDAFTRAITAKLTQFVDRLLDDLVDGHAGLGPFLHLPAYTTGDDEDYLTKVEAALSALAGTAGGPNEQVQRPADLGVLKVAWDDWVKDLFAIQSEIVGEPVAPPQAGTVWSVDKWLPVFRAAGWTTEGPQTIPNVDPGGGGGG